MNRRGWLSMLGFALLSMAAGVLVGMGSFTFQYANGLSYLSNDPKACINCHIMNEQYDGWQKASHHGFATCNDCHVPHDPIGKYLVKASNGYHHSEAFTLGNFAEPIRIKPGNAKVLEANCLSCHGDVVEQITVHGPLAEGDLYGCVRCHQGVGHGPAR